MRQILEHLFLFEDTCNVYVIRSGRKAVLVDFGSGGVLNHLTEIGVETVTDVLMTHHHRDQGQGLPHAVAMGIRIWVPHMEQELFTEVDAHWQAREVYNNYNMRQDRFSLLQSVPIAGTLLDYETRGINGYDFEVIPTPGHTIGSISLMSNINGQKVAFTGDLIAAPGQVWSLAATQWTYNGAEGVAAGTASLLDLKDRQPDLLLPSHLAPMDDPAAAIDLLVERFLKLLKLRGHNLGLLKLREKPYEPITPHLLRHRASMANTYVLISESKKALMIDFGYDFMTGFTAGYDRASRRPWLYTIPVLKQQFDIECIDVIAPTHFHDDHVAGINLLRRVEGTQVWAATLFADILEHPADYDLPCLWYDPIPVDRRLELGTAVQWEEYTLTLYPLPGHTRYAVAFAFEVDGKRVLAAGDQYQGDKGLEFNYVYPNRFQMDDYIHSAALYRKLNPDIIITGHWLPLDVLEGYFDEIDEIGAELAQLHQDLLPQTPFMGEEGFLARITPYQLTVRSGESVEIQVELHNPYEHPCEAAIQLDMPKDWQFIHLLAKGVAIPAHHNPAVLQLSSRGMHTLTFQINPQTEQLVRRTRIAVDVTINGKRFGQQAEALITVL